MPGMSLSLCFRQSLALEQRLAMEMRLGQRLSMGLKQTLRLELYRKREDAFTKLYKQALGLKMVRRYHKHGMQFEYALVQKKDLPDIVRESGEIAFSHCLYSGFDALFCGVKHALARGSWLLFVVVDAYPGMMESYIEYAAVHERGEQVTLGDHNLASKLEFSIARKEGKLTGYMAWLELVCPGKFADVFTYQRHLELPDSKSFSVVLNTFAESDEAKEVQRMIEEFEWPFRLLQKLTLYDDQNEQAIILVRQAWEDVSMISTAETPTIKELLNRMRETVAKRLAMVSSRNLRRYLSMPRIEKEWQAVRRFADQQFVAALAGRQRNDSERYMDQLIDAGIPDSIPRDGALSLTFAEALNSLEKH